MAKIGGMFFDEGKKPEEIEFDFDKFVNEIVDTEKKAAAKKVEGDEQENEHIHRYRDRARNRIRYGRKK